jgi:SLT domain-containing protein
VFGLLLKAINFVIEAVSKMLDVFRRVTESKAFQALLSGIGSIAGGIGSGLSRLGGIVGLASGGIVTKPTLAMVGEGGEPEAVIPLSKMGQMGGGTVINVQVGVGDPEAIARSIERILDDSRRRTGTLVAA